MKSGICVLSLVLCAVPAVAGTLVIGSPADSGVGNCFPFGCAYSGTYQQVYSATEFPGTITVTSLDFYNTEDNTGATAMNTGNFQISLSQTSANWNTLSATYASNVGADNTTVFDGSLSQAWTFGDTLVINLTTPFTYNPADGNLLLTVDATGTGDSGGGLFFDTNGYNSGSLNGDTYLGRDYTPPPGGSIGNLNYGYGLVTGFGTAATTVTPEPSSLMLLGSGLLATVGMIRRKVSR